MAVSLTRDVDCIRTSGRQFKDSKTYMESRCSKILWTALSNFAIIRPRRLEHLPSTSTFCFGPRRPWSAKWLSNVFPVHTFVTFSSTWRGSAVRCFRPRFCPSLCRLERFHLVRNLAVILLPPAANALVC